MKDSNRIFLIISFLIFTQNLKAQAYFSNSIATSKIEYKPLTNYFEYNNVEKNNYLNNVSITPLTIVKSKMYSFSSITVEKLPAKPMVFSKPGNLVERKYYSLAKTAILLLADASVSLTANSFK